MLRVGHPQREEKPVRNVLDDERRCSSERVRVCQLVEFYYQTMFATWTDAIDPPTLHAALQSPDASKMAIVDVRDEDRAEGWLKGSLHLPSRSLTTERMESFAANEAQQYEMLVFHCMLSQVRGPKARRQFEEVAQALAKRPRSVVLIGGYQGFAMYAAAKDCMQLVER